MLEEFTKYFNTFPKEDAIVFKYEHSLRVMNLCIMIGKSLNLTEEELQVVKLIGLLHDYSRLEQWKNCASFDDLKTFDHADQAVIMLFEKKEIEKYHLAEKYYKIVSEAIKNHNKYSIGDISEKSLLYCQIIRDADKLDILDQFKKAVFMDSNKPNFIHDSVKANFFDHKTVKWIDDLTINDLLIMKLALIYDLNFDVSFAYIRKNKMIENIEQQLDKNIFDIYIKEIKKYMEDIC